MDNFKEQLRKNLKNDINEFNSKPELAEIRVLYKLNFDTIKGYIQKTGHKLAVEEISNLDNTLKKIILDNILLLQQINKAISTHELNTNGINA